ncbi:MAG: hypothetical protein AAF074_12135, partial [Pseudomonadota bacterium]
AAVTFAPNTETTAALMGLGITAMVYASEHAWILQGARKVAADMDRAHDVMSRNSAATLRAPCRIQACSEA